MPRSRKTVDPALKGKRPINVPESAASFFLDWDVPWLKGAGLFGGVYYVGDRAANPSNDTSNSSMLSDRKKY